MIGRRLALALAAMGVATAVAPAARAACVPPVGDWSDFPGGYQCIVGVDRFIENKWGLVWPPTGGHPSSGNCQELGACIMWVYDLPDKAHWNRHPWGTVAPQLYDILIYPAAGGGFGYGHAAVFDHESGGAVYVMDDNWDGNEGKACVWEGAGHVGWVHTVNRTPYGFYRLKTLEPGCDEGATRACGSDVGACQKGVQTCTNDDWGACVGEIAPTAEQCNGADDDCDGAVDEELQKGCGSDVGVCKPGIKTCHDGDWGACIGGVEPSPEACNGLDDDCDGAADDDDVCEIDEAVEAHGLDLGSSSDVDGDGRADACALDEGGIVCALSTGHAFARAWLTPVAAIDARSVYTTLRAADVDGDGRADVCLRTHDGVSCFLSEGRGIGRQVIGPALSDEAGFGEPSRYSTLRLADVDGDGRADVCARGAAGLACSLSQGGGFAPGPSIAALSDAAGFDRPSRYATLRFGDVDGDGRADVCARDAAGMACWIASAGGFTARVAGPPWSDAAGFDAWRRWSTIRIADVDGDGRADLCAREASGFACYLFDGQGFSSRVAGPALDEQDDPARRDLAASLRLFDLDGDGRADLCARRPEGVACWLGSPHGFDRRVAGPAITDAEGWAEPSRFRTLRVADVRGDGGGALCGRAAEGVVCWAFGRGSFEERVIGPAWGDAAGFGAEARYASIRIATARRRAAGPRPTGAGGAAAAAPGDTNDLVVGSCGAAGRGGGGRGAWGLVLGAGIAIAARRRARAIAARSA